METQNDEISIKELFDKLKEWSYYLASYWKIIIVASVIGATIGLTYAIRNKPVYTASLSFALEENKTAGSLGGALGLASSLGIDIGGGGGGVFSGPNLTEFFKSRSMVEQTLMRPVLSNNDTISLIEMYLRINGIRENWSKNPKLKSIQFPPLTKRKYLTRVHDSIIGVVYKSLITSDLKVGLKDKKAAFTSIDVKSGDELFAKALCEALADEVSKFYVETKSKRARMNMLILQRQADSIRLELNGAITGVAVANDNTFMLNPALNVRRTPSTRGQIDVQANTAILSELVKQIEIAKVTLRKDTPLIQVIDPPILPLPKEKFGKSKGVVLGGVLAGFLSILLLIINKFVRDFLSTS